MATKEEKAKAKMEEIIAEAKAKVEESDDIDVEDDVEDVEDTAIDDDIFDLGEENKAEEKQGLSALYPDGVPLHILNELASK